jgi:sugar (pentulose or hexulose) kinase
LFADWTMQRFQKAVRTIGLRKTPSDAGKRKRARGTAPTVPTDRVNFEPYLAGERTSIDQRRAAFTGLTLSSTREEMLEAIIESLVAASAARLALLDQGGVKIRRTVVVSGGAQDRLDEIFHRDWPGRWTFKSEDEATLRGLALLTPRDSVAATPASPAPRRRAV